MTTTKFNRQHFEQRINALYAFALEQGYSITALGPGNRGQHHFLVQRGESYLEVTLKSQGTLLLSTEQGMNVHGRITPTLLNWLEREAFPYELDEPFSHEACRYLEGSNGRPAHAPHVARQGVLSESSDGGVHILQLLPSQPGWFAVYALDPDLDIDGGSFEELPIVGWAVTNREALHAGSETPHAVTSVVSLFVWGAVGKGSQPDAYPHVVSHDDDLFLGYNYPGCALDWKDRAVYQQKNLTEERQHHE